MTTNPPVDFDGCNRKCRQAGAHTLVWGECEQAPEPEPTVSLSRVYTDTDGCPSICFDSYTVPALAELIEPALRTVVVRLGPNALGMLERDETVRLSGGEYADLARQAAHAIVHRHDGSAVSSAVSVATPPTAQTAELRDRIAAALYERERPPRDPAWPDAYAMDREVFEAMADAVLGVLPPHADRAAAWRDLADRADPAKPEISWFGDFGHQVGEWIRQQADYEARNLAAETPEPATQARPAAHEWFVETPMLDGRWSKYGASRDTAADGQELFERDTASPGGKSHAFRLVHATTTYATEAEHQPDTETPDAPPAEPHPTEADLRHALAVAAKFHSQDSAAPTAYGDGMGRAFCLKCAPALDVDVPLTANDVGPGELCPSCGRDIIDVAHAAAPAVGQTDEEADDSPPAPLRRSEADCPGFPEHCPNLRPVDPNPLQHYGGIRCGCADEEASRG